jgi:hypothetical protein
MVTRRPVNSDVGLLESWIVAMDTFRKLQFTQEWIDLGIITPEKLNELEHEWQSSDDRNIEHYRWRAFLDFIQSNSSLDENVLRCLYRLGANEADSTMGGSIMAEVLRRQDCPEDLWRQATESGESFLRKIGEQKLTARS